MSEPTAAGLAEVDPGGVAGPPPTGDPAIDEAVLGLGELAATPLADHHDRLAQVHDVLSAALDPADPAAPPR